ncbi:hypothetical protein CALCODRAFT_478684 [Calocera cornea HHB12733]|uniref:Auxin efflux carrier n=1 Tax=Calocera cornea HHB12733 TaxID=1353952 RepID=A0A165K6P2_9BASI|nr:hypothetical protein CALCODRAFT_478684 [Calocera cornea HHB12733]
MPSSLLQSFLAALQSSLSVLLTLGWGVLAGILGLLSQETAKEVSHICVEMFLPALLITNIGKDLAREGEDALELWPILVWAIIYPFISLLLIWPMVKWLNFPTWSLGAVAFNNTTALPLLLLQSLRTTGILDSISQGDSIGSEDQATTYFLLNAMVNNVLTFALGPKLLGETPKEEEREDQVGGYRPHPILTVQSLEDAQEEAEEAVERTEDTPLLSKRIKQGAKHGQTRLKRATHSAGLHIKKWYYGLPYPIRRILYTIHSVINPPLVGAVLAIVIASVPFLRTAFFAAPKEGGVLKAWFTISLQNIGDLFNALQMFVVGSKLYESVVHPPKRKEDADPNGSGEDEPHDPNNLPKDRVVRFWPVAYMLVLRFIIMPGLSIGLVYLLAMKTNVLGNDAMMWFVLMLVAAGPPAINIASMAEVAGESEEVQGAIARFLVICYAITPAICFSVVGALRACEGILDQKGL